MPPATIALVIGLIEEAIKVTPGLIAELQTIFAKPDPTPEDWQALRDRVKNATYASLVPNSDLTTAADAGNVTAEHLASAPLPALPAVTNQAASDPAPVTDPGIVTADPSPAPAPSAPLSAAHVFALATTRV